MYASLNHEHSASGKIYLLTIILYLLINRFVQKVCSFCTDGAAKTHDFAAFVSLNKNIDLLILIKNVDLEIKKSNSVLFPRNDQKLLCDKELKSIQINPSYILNPMSSSNLRAISDLFSLTQFLITAILYK